MNSEKVVIVQKIREIQELMEWDDNTLILHVLSASSDLGEILGTIAMIAIAEVAEKGKKEMGVDDPLPVQLD